ncbi:hypothetical protein GCWU000246_01827 [Jonquetella anthropi E3_33 E1]|nr:hypothetical protein GCWU000246_01827 [Jonquetella anthropi E3_33 E1]
MPFSVEPIDARFRLFSRQLPKDTMKTGLEALFSLSVIFILFPLNP